MVCLCFPFLLDVLLIKDIDRDKKILRICLDFDVFFQNENVVYSLTDIKRNFIIKLQLPYMNHTRMQVRTHKSTLQLAPLYELTHSHKWLRSG